jgi:hypothetical protein
MALINTRVLMVFSRMIDFLPQCFMAIVEYARQGSVPLDGIQRAGIKSITIALACAKGKGKITSLQTEIITQWAIHHKLYSHKSKTQQRHFAKAVKTAVKFFNSNGDMDLKMLCMQISAVLPASDRYDVLDLCIKAAAGGHQLASEQVTLLKLYRKWLQLDTQRFRIMIEKNLPIDSAGSQDIELLLGIDSEMSEEQVQAILAEEFQKWNSRITNHDPAVRKRADEMLRLITDQRMAYTS